MMNAHETFLQKIHALGVAANFIANRCPDQYKHCKDAARQAGELMDQLRDFPKWKKDLFNQLFIQEEEK